MVSARSGFLNRSGYRAWYRSCSYCLVIHLFCQFRRRHRSERNLQFWCGPFWFCAGPQRFIQARADSRSLKIPGRVGVCCNRCEHRLRMRIIVRIPRPRIRWLCPELSKQLLVLTRDHGSTIFGMNHNWYRYIKRGKFGGIGSGVMV